MWSKGVFSCDIYICIILVFYFMVLFEQARRVCKWSCNKGFV